MDANKIITLTVICYLYETRPVDFSCVLFIYLFIYTFKDSAATLWGKRSLAWPPKIAQLDDQKDPNI